MVPEGWTIEFVGVLFDVQLGKMLNKEAAEKKPQFHYLGNSNVKWGHFDLSDLKMMHFSERDVEKFTLKSGDIIMCEGGEVGRCAIWEGSSKNIFYQKALHRLRSKGKIVPQFFQFYVERISGTKLLDDYTTRTSIAHLTREKLISMPVKLPPLSEQKRIAQILSTWDKAITTTEQLLANSQQQKKALMQQLLTGKKRLLDKTGVRFGGEWETYNFATLFIERVETGRVDLPLLSITADDGVVYQEDTGRKNTSNDDKSKYRRICVNDIGYNTMRMWQGRSSLSDKEGIVSPAYTIITPTSKICPAYAAYLFKLPALVHTFYRHSQGLVSDTWNLKFNHFKKINWKIPYFKEQQKIATVLSTADQEISALQQKLDALKQEKKALMQQLLTGKRRVNIENKEVA